MFKHLGIERLPLPSIIYNSLRPRNTGGTAGDHLRCLQPKVHMKHDRLYDKIACPITHGISSNNISFPGSPFAASLIRPLVFETGSIMLGIVGYRFLGPSCTHTHVLYLPCMVCVPRTPMFRCLFPFVLLGQWESGMQIFIAVSSSDYGVVFTDSK